MTRIWLPDRFIARTADELVAEVDNVGAHYWYRCSTGDVTRETALGQHHSGAYAAMNWITGAADVPPGFHAARLRTRYDLLDILRVTELALNDEISRWEDTVRGGAGGANEHFPRGVAGGARLVYEWAVGLRQRQIFEPLLDEHVREARAFFAEFQRRLAAQSAEPRYRAA